MLPIITILLTITATATATATAAQATEEMKCGSLFYLGENSAVILDTQASSPKVYLINDESSLQSMEIAANNNNYNQMDDLLVHLPPKSSEVFVCTTTMDIEVTETNSEQMVDHHAQIEKLPAPYQRVKSLPSFNLPMSDKVFIGNRKSREFFQWLKSVQRRI